ncbi:MAG: alpha/beta fold hydrolase [Pirellulales bacterium]
MIRALFAFVLFACALAARGEEPAVPRDPDNPHARLLVVRDREGREHPVRNAGDWEIRRAEILAGMQEAMGPLPKRASGPLHVAVDEQVEGDNFVRQTISFAVEGDDRLTAFLYVPRGLEEGQRRPAMLALHPTGVQGKGLVAGLAEKPNRAYALELAERGYVVLAPDYPSFGGLEDYNFEADDYVSGTMKGIVNHMRSVDLLQGLPQVDPERIGVIGHSLGGHNAMFVGAFDQRLKVVVSSCGWTPFHYYYGGKLAGWTSARYMPRIAERFMLNPDRVPFDFYGVAGALAPRAFFSNSPTGDDNFDYQGVKRAEPIVREVYALLGAEDRLRIRYPDCGHDFPRELRQEAYEFIDQVLAHTPDPRAPELD